MMHRYFQGAVLVLAISLAISSATSLSALADAPKIPDCGKEEAVACKPTKILAGLPEYTLSRPNDNGPVKITRGSTDHMAWASPAGEPNPPNITILEFSMPSCPGCIQARRGLDLISQRCGKQNARVVEVMHPAFREGAVEDKGKSNDKDNASSPEKEDADAILEWADPVSPAVERRHPIVIYPPDPEPKDGKTKSIPLIKQHQEALGLSAGFPATVVLVNGHVVYKHSGRLLDPTYTGSSGPAGLDSADWKNKEKLDQKAREKAKYVLGEIEGAVHKAAEKYGLPGKDFKCATPMADSKEF